MHAIKDVDDNHDVLHERQAAHAAGHDEAIDENFGAVAGSITTKETEHSIRHNGTMD